MICSAEEIERKRKEAQQKLAQKRLSSPYKSVDNSSKSYNFVSTTSPKLKCFSEGINRSKNKPYDKVLQFYGKTKIVEGKIVLISNERFKVEVGGINPQIIDTFKSVNSRNYDPRTKTWSFDLNDYDLLVRNLQKIPDFALEKLPPFVVKCLKTSLKSVDINFNRLDPKLSEALLPFQVEGLSFGLDRGGRCLIADEMGLGKTFQALAIMNYYKDDWPLLIATNATMRNVWEETIFKFLPSVSMLRVQYMTTSKDYINDAHVLIVSHDLMSRCLDTLLQRNFGAFIVDESHVLKNYKTKVSNAASELAKKAKRLVLLSGTPALSRPSELYTQLQMIDPYFFGSFFEFSKRYCEGKQTNFGWNSSGQSNLNELEIILQKKFMIRRTKDIVITSLPSLKKEVINLDVKLEKFSKEDRNCLKALAMQYNSENKGHDKHALLLTYFGETSKIKIPSVCSYVLQILQKNRKFLFFAHHQNMLNAVEEVVKQKNIKYIRIDGNTSVEQRKYFVDKFQLDDSYMIAILSITAANAGITLTAAQLVVFGELHWNPSILAQAEARAHRIGQEGDVLVQYLLASATADDTIWPMLQEKQKILQKAGLSKDSLEAVQYKRQEIVTSDDLTDGISVNVDTNLLNLTSANTLDISNYFKKTSNSDLNKLEESIDDMFDDGLDDIMCNMELPDS